jgi:hypothetical protein
LNLFHHLKLTNVVEVGAGCALLTRRLLDFSDHKITIESSDSHSKEFSTCTLSTYSKVNQESFKDIKSKDAVVISWLHENYQQEFLLMIKRNQPPYVFHLGEADGACYTDEFPNKMKEMGYNMMLIPCLSLAHMDYFTYDGIRPKDKPSARSCISFFYREDLKEEEILEVCGKKNLGLYMPCDALYAMQDMGLYNQKKQKERRKLLGVNENSGLQNYIEMLKMLNMIMEMNVTSYKPLGLSFTPPFSSLEQFQTTGRTYRTVNALQQQDSNEDSDNDVDLNEMD